MISILAKVHMCVHMCAWVLLFLTAVYACVAPFVVIGWNYCVIPMQPVVSTIQAYHA